MTRIPQESAEHERVSMMTAMTFAAAMVVITARGCADLDALGRIVNRETVKEDNRSDRP